MPTISVQVKSRIPAVRAAVQAKAGLVIAKAAHDIEAQAKTRAPVDTGLLKNSIRAEGDGTSWQVVSPVAYSVYQEFGTRHTPARPYMLPALELVRPSLIAALRSLV